MRAASSYHTPRHKARRRGWRIGAGAITSASAYSAALLKCLIEGYAIGQSSRASFDFLLEDPTLPHRRRPPEWAFSSAHEAYRALVEYAPFTEHLWSLRNSLGLEMPLDTYVDYGLLPESAREETMTLTSAEQVDEFILRCARYTLLDSRRQALQAFREGFQLAFNTNGVADSDANTLDVSPVLALFTPKRSYWLAAGSITAAG